MAQIEHPDMEGDVSANFAEGSVAVVLGTRPEAIKMANVVKLLGRAAYIVHTGQHYDSELRDAVHLDLGLPVPALTLDVGGRSRMRQVAGAVARLDRLFTTERPAIVMVHGDTNSALAGALAANGNDIPVAHVEAGLRSYDRRMPEEHNRVLTDHLAALLCAPTPKSAANLVREGIAADTVVLTGNTIVEAVGRQLPSPADRRRLLDAWGLAPEEYILTTVHRPENTDDPSVLAAILGELAALPLPVVFPAHPRTLAAIDRYGMRHLLRALRVTEPVSPSMFVTLERHAAMVVSDSGGVQEECAVLKRPLIVVRRSTERPETLGQSSALVSPGDLIGKLARSWLADLPARLAELRNLPCPYGDGTASNRVVAALVRLFGSRAAGHAAPAGASWEDR